MNLRQFGKLHLFGGKNKAQRTGAASAQPISEPINQRANQSASQSISEPTNQQANQSTSQPINKPTNQQVYKTAAAPAGSAEAFRQAPQLVAIGRIDYCCRVITSRRFCAQQDSLFSVQTGRSLP
jgi:hypothetical protein